MSPDERDGEWLVVATEECLERWAAIEHPPEDLRIIVATWLMTRMDNPHRDVDRMPDFPGWWFGKVAGCYGRPLVPYPSSA